MHPRWPVVGLALAGLLLALAPAGSIEPPRAAASVRPARPAAPGERPPERRPLLLILFSDPQQPPLAHPPGYYADLVAATDPSIAGYYRAQSQGRFTYVPAGRVSVTDTGGLGLGTGSRERGLTLAARSGYRFADHDTDRDRTLTAAELTVLVVDNRSEGAGATRRVCRRLPGPVGVRYCANVASAGHRSSLANDVHELAHTLTPPAVDLYGPGHRCLSSGLTLMSCTAGAGDDPTQVIGLDPMHRRTYGWLPAGPSYHRRAAAYRLQPAGPDPPAGGEYAVRYRRPGATESVIFEVRNRSAYDTRLPGSGLYVWYDDPSARLPSLSTPGESEPAAFVLGPDHCVLTPMSPVSRGHGSPLRPGGYRVHWRDGRDSGTLLRVRPADRKGRVRLELTESPAIPECGR